MSTGSNYASTSVASRPILAPGATTQFQTWSSIDQELAPSLCPPQTAKAPRPLHGAGRKLDRALFSAIRSALEPAQLREALLNILLVSGAVGLIITVAAAVLIAPYILFFVET